MYLAVCLEHFGMTSIYDYEYLCTVYIYIYACYTARNRSTTLISHTHTTDTHTILNTCINMYLHVFVYFVYTHGQRSCCMY